MEGRVQVATADGVIACVKAGLGIAVASRWMCRAELQTGELVSILSDYQLESIELHAVYPAGRRPSVKVRAFSDYLAAKLIADDGRDELRGCLGDGRRTSTQRSGSSRIVSF